MYLTAGLHVATHRPLFIEGSVNVQLAAGNSDFKRESQVRTLREIVVFPDFRNFVEMTGLSVADVCCDASRTH